MCGGLCVGEFTLPHEFFRGAIQNTFSLQDIPCEIVAPFMTAPECARTDKQGNYYYADKDFIFHGVILPSCSELNNIRLPQADIIFASCEADV